ncbi:Vacuolar protein sorting-associated protein 62 [Phaffia rhodozyma]|uniref:Vacuolar protein sorting-associated protein 62 n=1 Tax=Phaffia rhodozyma TaxID=264483 RepID=A0A0F7SNV4_PHARH|nr:Vacuolar protein sorting-associated protein 62 [Phaffia rhodozyma]
MPVFRSSGYQWLLAFVLSLPLSAVPSNSLPSPIPPPTPPIPPQSSGPVPPYVLTYAPLVHLSTDELYWPSKISTHLEHTTLRFSPNRTTVPNLPPPGTLIPDTLGFLGNRSELFLEAGVMDEAFKAGHADWLGSEYGKPDNNARSEAEAVIILVDKSEIIGEGYLDAFYFTFYSYNEGNTLFDIRFGDHVGDWEHIMIRFYQGMPQQIFLSEHAFGEIWPFDVIDKGLNLHPRGKEWGWEERPVVYSAEGSHALYGTPGRQEYLLPFGLLSDTTSKGPLWDPTLNHLAYWLNTSTSTWWTQFLTFVPAEGTPISASFLDYAGRWGDEFWSAASTGESMQGQEDVVKSQWCYAGNCRYVNGPMGPRYKYLDRRVLDPVDFTFNLILAISAIVLLVVMTYALVCQIRRSSKEEVKFKVILEEDIKSRVEKFDHLFPFCFMPAFKLTPEPLKRPGHIRQRRATWYAHTDERTPLL